MNHLPEDIYTEPSVDVHTLNNLGPLRRMAGIWTGTRGLDVKPKADGPHQQVFIEHIELQPIDPVTNGPQLFYGLRYYLHINKPEQAKSYHEQVGYWLWEPATGAVIQTLAIPRGQIAMASATVAPDAGSFELVAERGSTAFGICSNPFLEHAFTTLEYRVKVQFNPDGSWRYDETTLLQVLGQDQPFQHTDGNLLNKIGEPTPNPMALQALAAAATAGA